MSAENKFFQEDDYSDESSSEEEQEVVELEIPRRSKKHKFLTITESFDPHKLKYILDHRDDLQVEGGSIRDSEARMEYLERCFGEGYDPYLMAEKYLKKSKDGEIQVTYKQGGSIGRYHAVGGLSQQGMPLEIRHTIARELYDDIDIENAHPVILAFMCSLRKIKTVYLNKYIAKRNKYLKLISKDRNFAKQIVLSLLNGGTKDFDELRSPPTWLKKFKDEMRRIHRVFAKDAQFKAHKNSRQKSGKTHNHEASYMNILLCDFENKILMSIYKFLDSPDNCVLCFDGIQIKKGTLDKQRFNIKGMEKHILKSLGIQIKLTVKEMKLAFELPADISPHVDYRKPNTFDYGLNYSFAEFQDEFREKTFQSFEDLDIEISQKYPLVLAKVLGGKGKFLKKARNGSIETTDSLGISNFDMYYVADTGSTGKERKIKERFDQYLRRQNGFGDVECKLKPEDCDHRNFNLWTGFQAERVEIKDQSEETKVAVESLKVFLYEVWASNNPEYFKYIVSWFANIVKTGDINRVAMVLISQPGCGKGFFVNFMRYIIRGVNMTVLSGIKAITQKHNTVLENQRFICVDEMSSTKDEFRSNFDRLKAYITDPKISIEPKGVNPFTIDNISNFILCSNHEDSIIVEENDRRYSIFKVSEKYRGNEQYWINMQRKCYNQDVANAFYTFLLDFECLPSLRPIETDIRRRALNLSKPAPLKFVDSLSEVAIKNNLGEPMKKIYGLKLYTKFREWCMENGERNICSNTKFGICIKDKMPKTRTNAGVIYNLPDVPILQTNHAAEG